MKITNPLIESPFITGDTSIPVLVIENKQFFRNLLSDICRQVDGFEGETVLSNNEKQIDFAKNAEIIDSYLTFTINRKNLLTKIVSSLEKEAVSESMYIKSAEIINNIEQYMISLCESFACDLEYSKISIPNLLKMAGITIRDEYNSMLERIIDYMELVREFDRDKLFLFVNLKTYFSDEEILPFYETVIGHGFNVFLIESTMSDLIEYERRTIIDKDLCEI